jgi:hypothetical protein
VKTFQLLPGDVLLYRPTRDIAGMLTAIKTGHAVGHCELVVKPGRSYTSRIPYGAGVYKITLPRLFKVLRPKDPLDFQGVWRYIETVEPEPYGWLDLLAYMGAEKDWPGRTCSTAVAEALRGGGLDPFDGDDARRIMPFQFDLSDKFTDYVIDSETEVIP